MTNIRRIRLTERERFAFYLRTGRILPEVKEEAEETEAAMRLETKFNPYHDPMNGRFTFAPGGAGSGRHSSPSRRPVPRPHQTRHTQTIIGHQITVPMPRAKPLDTIPTERHRDGSISTPIFDHRSEPERSYRLRTDAIVIHPAIADKVEAAGAEFRRETGKTMVVNSGTRSAMGQAKAMYDKFSAGVSGTDYKNQAALKEIKDVYVAGREAGQSESQIVADMGKIISKQIDGGIYISRHLTNGAIDIKINDLAPSERKALKDAVRRAGGTIHSESKPPHLHVQF